MKNLLDKIFPTLSDELIIVISLIIGLLVTASLILFLVKKIFPKTNISELAARTRSWWIMAGMFIGAVFISYNISYFFLAFLSFIAFRELYSVLGFREADRGALFWGILAIPIQYYLAYLAWYGAFIIFIPVVMFLVLPLRLVLKGDTHGITKSMALLQWILMLSVFGISHLAYLLSLPELPGFSSGGRGLLLFLVFLTEINDVMQFIWGKLLGRHKILPKISPNKTWEGFLGGLGLAAGLSPATAREALERMDRVQALEAERLRLDEELERQERERDALRMPLRDILRQLGRLPDASANNAAEEPDWPGCLEALLREWESARAENAEVVRLRARSEEQAVEVGRPKRS